MSIVVSDESFSQPGIGWNSCENDFIKIKNGIMKSVI